MYGLLTWGLAEASLLKRFFQGVKCVFFVNLNLADVSSLERCPLFQRVKCTFLDNLGSCR